MMRPDVVFVAPSDRDQVYQGLGLELTAIEPPVWTGMLAEYTRRKGYGVEIIDMDAHGPSVAQVAEQIVGLDPALVCVVVYGHHPSASTQNMPAVRKVCQAIKDHHPQTPILLAGGHVAALPERTMREEPCDFVSDGEGMATIVGLIETLRAFQQIPTTNADMVLSKVPDLWYRSLRGIYRSPVRAPLLQDLDGEMPGLAWDLLPMDKYRSHDWHAGYQEPRSPYGSLYTTLGCQFKCSFCLSAGTMVATVDGNDRRIEDLGRGDRLVAWDERTRGFVETTIVSTSCRLVAPLRRIKTASGREICITRDHPVLTMLGWVEAGSLRREDFVWVMEKDGETPLLNYEAIADIEEVSDARPVYNFQCHPYDNYFAGQILVHNCCIQAPFRQGETALGYKETRNSYRYWSPDAVIAQIDALVTKYGVRHLKFADEMFVLTPKHVEAICDKIIERGYDLNIWAYARVDTTKERMLDKLKRAGFNYLAFGIEAAAERVRDDVQKGFDQDDIFDTLERVRQHGIHIGANYIFGLPEDDVETMQQTLDLALAVNAEYSNFYCLGAGSPVYTPSGWQPIETITAGDSVMSVEGATQVVGCSRRHYAGCMYTVRPRYLPSVSMTPEHPILCAQIQRDRRNRPRVLGMMFKKPDEIVVFDSKPNTKTIYDAVVVSKRSIMGQDNSWVSFKPYVMGHLSGQRVGGKLKKGGQLGPRGRNYLSPCVVTEEMAELLGWYVADGSRGSVVNNQIAFAIGAHEPHFVQRVQHLVKSAFGLKTQCNTRGGVTRVFVVSKVLRRALPELCGDVAHRKRVPRCVMEGNEKVAAAFLRGYIDGDGTSSPNAVGQFAIGTVSEQLVRDLIILFLRVGIVPSWSEIAPRMYKFPGNVWRSCRRVYRLSWTGKKRKGKRYLEDESYYYIPIRSVTTSQYDGDVYNLETGDHRFGVPFITHNCTMSYPGSALYEQAVRDGRPLPPSWEGYSQHGYETWPSPTKYVDGPTVLRFRDQAFTTYFTNPGYLGMIERTFGTAAVDHIRRMVAIPLKRRYLIDETHSSG